MMQPIDQFIAQYIPAAQALNLRVVESSPQRVVIKAPFECNSNHHHTMFGGSQALLATLSAWSLAYLNFPDANGNIVIRSSQIRYLKPAPSDVIAVSICPDSLAMNLAKQMLTKKGKAKITIQCQLYYNDIIVSEWTGEFVLSRELF
ncbi:YiiD C-terminal domain-containing protein [Basfia succiniciproducens]|uniref:YiiD C-terminal domain-containing protein n=1 Tax=Basfia succiniciproducens TaxID=653940 RepID=UPI000C1BC0F2|nr:YiiD C-terminal domain-containing protein [Basfia succiniciproducens]